jgi:hypothetical protein
MKESGVVKVVAYNLAGDSWSDALPEDATLGYLAGKLVKWHGRCRPVTQHSSLDACLVAGCWRKRGVLLYRRMGWLVS